MLKYLLLALLLATPARAFDRALLPGRWHCAASADARMLNAQRVLKTMHISSVSDYGSDGHWEESGQIQVALPRGPSFTYRFKSRGRWHLRADQLHEQTESLELEAIHEPATRRWLALNAASRRLEAALAVTLREALADPTMNVSQLLALDRQSLRLRSGEFSGSCTRL